MENTWAQARNQEFSRVGEFLINNHLQHEKERPRREKSPVFSSRKS